MGREIEEWQAEMGGEEKKIEGLRVRGEKRR